MTIKLEPEEVGYLLGLLKEHVEYHRLLAGNGKCSPKHKDRYRMLETLWSKLAK